MVHALPLRRHWRRLRKPDRNVDAVGRALSTQEANEVPDMFPRRWAFREVFINVDLADGCARLAMGRKKPAEELAGFGDLLLGAPDGVVHVLCGRKLRLEPPKMVPLGEAFDRGVDVRSHLKDVEPLLQPLFEHGQLTVVLSGKHAVVGQYRSQVLNSGSLWQRIEGLVRESNLSGSQAS